MKIRSREPELIDLGREYYTQKEYNNCLYQLGRIGKYFGANNAMLKIFRRLQYEISNILDVGCGGGFFANQLAINFKNSKVTGIDINPDAIEYAKKINKLNNLKFELKTTPELNELPKSYDIVTATLVCHHLSDQEIVDFLKRAKLVARKNIIINDLQRSKLSYIGALILMPLFFNNRLIKNDSLLSIKKSFTYSDWIYYLYNAGFKTEDYIIKWYWPFRWIVKVDINE